MRLLGLGDNTVDTYLDRKLQYPGGNAVNVAVMAKRLGLDSHYLGCLGSDVGGDLLLSSLAAEGVETPRVRRRSGQNARAFIGHRNGDRYFIRSIRGVRAEYELNDSDFAYIAEFDVVHTSIYSEIDDYLPKICPKKALSFDFSNRWTNDYLEKVLPSCRWAFLSASELPEGEVVSMLQFAASLGPEIVVATRGEKPCFGLFEGKLHVQEALPTTVADTLGAGDAFIAGVLTTLLKGNSFPNALQAGASNAALACQAEGGFGHGIAYEDGGEA
ncbi:putative fructoselysine kinase [Agrobacterium tumefaciens str. Kerr 14]|uniref:Putative fructoselysine kinase n=1 Tax=Agrobacterium tumefaciens str. Kerr 14 TaxID=1183424 RepID=A0A1S7SC96_AGRTU|nr:PfkB family carbohydrate kinase [Agrobacterium tumefaciens]CUX65690.1 putative fructoselysine kinase [Agrobacterium tumefaciens str. Kerr 14]